MTSDYEWVPVRKCIGCGNSFVENTDHEYCTPECYSLSNQKEDRWQEEHLLGQELSEELE